MSRSIGLPSRPSRSQWLPQMGGLLLLTIIALLLTGYFLQVALQITDHVLGVPLDDAWIHFQFARNLSQGQGFSYNPGEPTPGSTAPLWTLLLAGVGLFSADFLRPALALSVLFFLLSIWLTFGFTFWITKSLWAAFLAGLGTIFVGRFLWAGLAAMETTAFAAMSLAAIFAYSKYGLRPSSALLFALASQLRPEGHALFALALVDNGWQWFVEHRWSSDWQLALMLRRFLLPLIVYGIISIPYTLFSLTSTGHLLPNTFYAKVGSEHLFSLRTLRETIGLHWQDNPASLLLLLIGILPLWRHSRLAVLWLLGLPLFTAVIIDFTWHYGRYTMPLIPLQIVAAATGAHFLVSEIAERKSSQQRNLLSRSLIVLFFAVMVVGGIWRLPRWATLLGNGTQEILDIDVALGTWLAENTPPDAVVAVDDIGAIGFLSERRIIDMNGLVTPEVWPAVRAQEGLERNQMLTRILSQLQPDFIAAFPLWRWDIATNEDVSQPLHHVTTDTHTIIFQQDAYIYKMTWPYLDDIDPENELDVFFGQGLRLLGYDLTLEDHLELDLYWTSDKAVTESYDIFVHVVDENQQIVAQADGKPVSGLAATDVWQPGDVIRDPRTISLPEDLASGEYQLLVGVYLRENGQRLPVSSSRAVNNALILSSISLP